MKEVYIVGRNPVLEVLKSEKEIEKILVVKGELKGSINKIIGIAKDRNIIIQQVDKNKLEQISQGSAHQGVAALITPFTYSSIDKMLEKAEKTKKPPFLLILDEIEDPHNLGAIIRTAECGGVHGIIIPKRRSAHVTQTVYKSSAGAVEHMDIAKVTNISDTIEELKERGLWIYGADINGEDYYYNMDLSGPVALIIGSEGKGISRLVKEKCDFLLKIPMFGEISSLNASNATSILIYEVVRQNYGAKRKNNKEYLFVDGYNIINSWNNLRELSVLNLEIAREELIEIMSEYQHYAGIKIIIVFDAHLVKQNSGKKENIKGIEVVYTRENETADQYIERRLDDIGRIERVRVATSDWMEQQIILGRGGTRISARELEVEIFNHKTLMQRKSKTENVKNDLLIGRLDEEALKKLNKWRKNKE